MSYFDITSRARFSEHTLICEAQDGVIYALTGNERQPIGVTNATHTATVEAMTELEATTKEYYDKLVELGEIVPEPTPEDIMETMRQELAASQEINRELLSILHELKGAVTHEHKPSTAEQNTGDVPKNKPVSRNKASARSDEGRDPGDGGENSP